MQKIVFIKEYGMARAGEIFEVENNVAHQLIDKGVACLKSQYKGFDKPQNDKMVTRKKNKIKVK